MLCSAPAVVSCPGCRKAARSGARRLLTSPPLVAESLLFGLHIKLEKGTSQPDRLFGGCMCLRTGSLIPMSLIEDHQSRFKVCSEAISGCLLVTLERGAHSAQQSHPSSSCQDRSAAAGCSPICFRGKPKKKTNQTRTMHRESTSKRTVCSL